MLHPNQGFTYNKFEKPNDWPKIDKTFDYKIENGKLLSGNEHIYLSGPVTYNIVGNPTIVDGIVTDFTTTSYLMTNLQFDFSQTDYEFVIRATPHAVSGRNAAIVGTHGAGLRIYFKQDAIECLSGNTAFAVRGTFDVSSFYYVRLIRKGNVYTLDYSLDGINYTGTVSVTSQQHLSGNFFLRFGYYSSDGWDPLDGKIDINHTYIKVNDRLWFYGKNYTTSNIVPVPKGLEYNNTTTPEIGWIYTDTSPVKGHIDYTVVGNPTIVNKVASGFSINDYLSIPASFLYETNAEIVIKAKPGLDNTKVLAGTLSGGLGIYFNQAQIYLGITDASSQSISGTFDSNTYYYIRVRKVGSTFYLDYSTDGTTYTGEKTIANVTVRSQTIFTFGRFTWDGFSSTSGYIDLNHTYIMINGQPWFGNCPTFQNFIPVPEGTMIGKDDTHSLAVETYQDKGIVDYNVIGTPMIKDGIISGFSDSDYITAAYPTTIPTRTECIINFTTGDAITGANNQSVLNFVDFLNLEINTSGQLYTYDYTARQRIGNVNLATNTNYYCKILFENGQKTLSLSTDGENYTTFADFNDTTYVSLSGTVCYGKHPTNANRFFKGSINLNNTYIKINGEYWFHPYPNSFPKLVGPVNYEIIGNPTIENGIVSEFSANDYVRVTNPISLSGKQVEMVLQFNTTSVSSQVNVLFGANALMIIAQGPYLQCVVYYSGGNSNTTFGRIEPNTNYWIKLIVNEGSITKYISTNGVNYNYVETVQVDTSNVDFKFSNLGTNMSNYFYGSIDLNETYIKVNNILWFGKENWKPSTYTDNSIYLLAGHKSDYSQYNELDFTPEITGNNTYNVSIDNQEILTDMSSGTHIEWDKLDLTTGYNITTPSTLKVHIIKISPTDNTKNITRYYCDSNYIIKDGKLIWADPRIYLQSDGNQYINTGVVPNSNTSIMLKFSDFPATGNSEWLFGARDGYLLNAFGFYATGNVYQDCFGNSLLQFQSTITDAYELKKESNFTQLDTSTLTHPTSVWEGSYPMFLFCLNNAGNKAGVFPGVKINKANINKNGIKIREIVPVYAGLQIGNFTVPSNGMFDIVNQQFYANQGTGEFTYGKDSN